MPNFDIEPTMWTERHGQLARYMHGFTMLTVPTQGMLVGYSLTTGEIWNTNDIATTRAIVRYVHGEFNDMSRDWGYEQ